MTRRWMILLFAVVLGICWSGCEVGPGAKSETTATQPGLPAEVVEVNRDMQIYRSPQPDRAEFQLLANAGFQSILNLREFHSDARLIKGTPLREYRLRTNAGSLNEEQIVEALKILKNAPKPIVVHCLHGADRTGTVIAASRIVFENWTVEDAAKEMLLPQYGHHSSIYPNLLKLLQSIDWNQIRTRIKTPENI